MKPMYKLGSFVEYNATAGTLTGTIQAQVVRKDGVSYEVSGFEAEVAEHNILNVYRKVVPRTPRAAKSAKKASTRRVKADAQAQAAA